MKLVEPSSLVFPIIELYRELSGPLHGHPLFIDTCFFTHRFMLIAEKHLQRKTAHINIYLFMSNTIQIKM